MARSYTVVLEDTIKYQTLQICTLVSENETLREVNEKLGNELRKAQSALSEYLTDSPLATDGSKVVQFEPLSELIQRPEAINSQRQEDSLPALQR